MNNHKWAERLVQKYQGQYSLRDAVEEIAAQLDEAVKEATDGLIERHVLCIGEDPTAKVIFDKGYAAAKAQGIKIVETSIGSGGIEDGNCYPCDCHDKVPQMYYSERIRAMTPAAGEAGK